MDNTKNDAYYLSKLLKDLNFLISHTGHLVWENFGEDEVLLDSVMFRLIQISENAARLSEDLKTAYADIPWLAMRGLRNRIVHDYGEVDYRIVFETVKVDIPLLYESLKEIEV
ncbi:MAG: DUF86 domain-containing protein [Oscillospiraceae bacterium]|nr:DUF86 domain-containing protein [Oscillospiraceae bacterium]MBQ7119302.1 DUF86 domain-containing protein [Oscillospiraceae bacterium]